jgi:hypothetical protein
MKTAILYMVDGSTIEVTEDKAQAIYAVLNCTLEPRDAAQEEFCIKVSNISFNEEKPHPKPLGKVINKNTITQHHHEYKSEYIVSEITNMNYSASRANRVIEIVTCDCGDKYTKALHKSIPKDI